jgi:hypothetical protein
LETEHGVDLGVLWLLIWELFSALNLDLELQLTEGNASLAEIVLRIANKELMFGLTLRKVRTLFVLPVLDAEFALQFVQGVF